MSATLHPDGRWLGAFLVTCLAFRAGVLAQAEDESAGEGEEEGEVIARYIPRESDFDSWVFNHGESEVSVRTRLEGALELHIDDLSHSGTLTGAQRDKLQLAGQGDIHRFFEEVETLRRRFLVMREELRQGREERLGEMWKETEPLRLKLAAGLFRDGSIFRKSLRRVLTAEHLARQEQVERERRALTFRSRVEWVVAVFDNAMPMRDAQRQALVRFLLAETRPSRRSGDYDHYVILWQMSHLPDEKLKPLFDEGQWKLVEQQFRQLKGVKEHLERHGWLELEGDPAPGEPGAAETKKAEK